ELIADAALLDKEVLLTAGLDKLTGEVLGRLERLDLHVPLDHPVPMSTAPAASVSGVRTPFKDTASSCAGEVGVLLHVTRQRCVIHLRLPPPVPKVRGPSPQRQTPIRMGH